MRETRVPITDETRTGPSEVWRQQWFDRMELAGHQPAPGCEPSLVLDGGQWFVVGEVVVSWT